MLLCFLPILNLSMQKFCSLCMFEHFCVRAFLHTLCDMCLKMLLFLNTPKNKKVKSHSFV